MSKYEEKLEGMHKKGVSISVILHFIERDGGVVTSEDINKFTGLNRHQIRGVIRNLREYGWLIKNKAVNGHPAEWVLEGVWYRKSKKARTLPKPPLNPLIEQVFC